MADIHVLDPHIADLIAAGEVVERPASAVKELMENAIDAGANAITVEIRHGGLTFLRVTDNGGGIPAGQLKTAFLRHATSKLRTEYDLEAIGTLGFRGEALAAISAVSRMDVMSRTPDSPIGASLSLEGGEAGAVEEAGCPLGTTMVVRDLFFNTPARLKFMKKDAAEGAAVSAIVQRTALAHPEVSVKFIRDGRQELLTPGDGQLQSAVYAVLGRELALGMIPVNGSGEDLTVTGFAAQPSCCRPSRNWQFFFVNGRPIKSRLMMAALEEAYQNQKMVGRFPSCVLHLTVKRNAVDVNVHPAKTEVKFGYERQVFQGVYHGVLSALERGHTRPQVTIERPPAADLVTPSQTRIPSPPPARLAVSAAAPMPRTSPMPRTGPIRPILSPAPALAEPPGAARRASRAVEENVDNVDNPVEKVESVREQGTDTADYVRKEKTVRVERPETAKFDETPEDPPLVEEQPWRVAGEVLNTYIIVEQGDKILFIDKHAAHERMNFDRMKAQGYEPMVQTLLSPAVCRLAPEEHGALLAHLPLLGEFGFGVEDFGGGSLIVREAPFDIEVGEVESTLSQLAQRLLTTGSADPGAARDELLHTMACKAAIKGGWKTSPQELEKVAQAVLSGAVRYCPHGRPVAIELTRAQLEKQFKRA